MCMTIYLLICSIFDFLCCPKMSNIDIDDNYVNYNVIYGEAV